MFAVYILLALILSYASLYIIYFSYQSTYGKCDYYTKLLNGGIHDFRGDRYEIRICGTKKIIGSGDKVRLQVLGREGEILAARHFVFYWNSATEKEIEYGDKYILYYDISNKEVLNTIAIPPTTLDWITARIPLLD